MSEYKSLEERITYLDRDAPNHSRLQHQGRIHKSQFLVDTSSVNDGVSQVHFLGAEHADVEIGLLVETEEPLVKKAANTLQDLIF